MVFCTYHRLFVGFGFHFCTRVRYLAFFGELFQIRRIAIYFSTTKAIILFPLLHEIL